jgi:hypothetical protein
MGRNETGRRRWSIEGVEHFAGRTGLTARATPEALALLLAVGSVAHGQAGKAASAAAERLEGAYFRSWEVGP